MEIGQCGNAVYGCTKVGGAVKNWEGEPLSWQVLGP